uniref:ABC transporter ATP-binding protein n=1 Tax=Variovorax paradoxus TaxID=34073 RepID=UPI0024792E82
MPALTLERLEKRYPGHVAASSVSLSVNDGEFISLLGPSGCGKTTVLRMVAGLIEPTGGRILIDGRDVTALPTNKRNIGLVFQSYALFPHMSVFENVAFGLRRHEVLTPYAGLVYDLGEHYSAYASYTDIFQPQNYRDTSGRY